MSTPPPKKPRRVRFRRVDPSAQCPEVYAESDTAYTFFANADIVLSHTHPQIQALTGIAMTLPAGYTGIVEAHPFAALSHLLVRAAHHLSLGHEGSVSFFVSYIGPTRTRVKFLRGSPLAVVHVVRAPKTYGVMFETDEAEKRSDSPSDASGG